MQRRRFARTFACLMAALIFAGPASAHDFTGSEEEERTLQCPKDGESVPNNQEPPSSTECQGMPCYPDLASIPNRSIEIVDLFRRSEFVGAHVDEAIEVGAKAIWMQLGVVDEDAAQRATDAGLLVVMDRCPAIDHPRLVRN